MLNRINRLLSDEDDPPNHLEETIKELQNGIETIDRQLIQISETAQVYSTKLGNYHSQRASYLKKAQESYSKGLQAQALAPFKKVKILDQQIDQYRDLVQSIEESRNKLFSQKTELEFNKDQIEAQLRLGEINADSSQIHADVMENIMLLQNSGELSKYQELVQEAESKSEAIRDISGIDKIGSSYPENSDENQFFELETELKVNQEKIDQSSLDKLKVKYQSFFESDKTSDEEAERQKISMLRQLKESDTPKENRIKSFFKSSEAPPVSPENQDRIKNFFRD
ncbi:MAG: hypothetical protein JXR03_18955 [Cyclobacteriaceae bacterium]